MSDTTNRRCFLDIQRDAALEQIREQQAEFARVADTVLPQRRDALRRTSRRVSDVTRLGGDYLVEVTDRGNVMWTTVVGGKASIHYHHRQDNAILHLIARRYDDDNTNHMLAFCAGRVLGIPSSNA